MTKLLLAFLCLFQVSCLPKTNLPLKFVYLHEVDKTIIENSRYFSGDNFTARSVPGYTSPHLIATSKAARQLKLANQYFRVHGYQLVIYDAYRPQVAVDSFYDWAKNDLVEDKTLKKYYYPALTKKQLGGQYIKLQRSSHTRGSTFDLTLIKLGQSLKPLCPHPRTLNNGKTIFFLDDNTLDMGTSFDFFDPASRTYSKLVSDTAQKNRRFLRQGMQKFGFKAYKYEWWHFQLIDEPYPRAYFNFF